MITFDDGKWIGFLYDANGQKLRKTTSAGLVQDYVSGIEYKKGNLVAIYHEEGRTIPDGNSFKYQYALKDHLGNTRVMFSDDGNGVAELLNENHFYSFGLQMNGQWNQQTNPEQNYLFGGKELNKDYGLNIIDFINRNQDPTTGRFWQVDKLAAHPNQVDKSPYAYAWNNPVNLTDPDGNCPKCWISAFKVGKKAYKVYKKTGKLTPKSLKKAGLDEIVDVAGDLQTVFGRNSGVFDRVGAAADLIAGTDFNNKGNKTVSKALGLTDEAKNAKGGVYVLKDKNGTVKRTGRTKDLEGRKADHGRGEDTKDLEFQEVYRTDKYDEQRGLEGVLYEKHKGTANQSTGGLNKSRAVGEKNPKAEKYLDAADNYLNKNGYD